MARFRYALQPALDAAVARERAALVALERARTSIVALRGALDALVTSEAELRAGMRSVVRERRPAASLVDAGACAGGLALRRRGREATLGVAEAALRAARSAVAFEARRRTALERHRAKARAAWRIREDRFDASEDDEANAAVQARAVLVRKDEA